MPDPSPPAPPGTPPRTGDPAAIDFKSLPVVEIPLCRMHPTEEMVDQPSPEMVESLREKGNVNPILLGRHPEIAGEYEILDGHHRVDGLSLAGRTTGRCVVIDRVVLEIERHGLTMQMSSLHREIKSVERAARAFRCMEIDPSLNQKEIARVFGCSEATLSRDLNEYLMDPEFKLQTAGLATAVRQIIMPVKDPERRRRAIEYAKTPGEGGKKPGREKVALFLKRDSGEKKRGRKARQVKGTFEQRPFSFGLGDKDNAFAVAEWLKALAKKLEKSGGELPPDGWSLLFQ